MFFFISWLFFYLIIGINLSILVISVVVGCNLLFFIKYLLYFGIIEIECVYDGFFRWLMYFLYLEELVLSIWLN